MGLFDFLAPHRDFDADISKRSKVGKVTNAPWGEFICGGCGKSLTKFGMGHCKCPD